MRFKNKYKLHDNLSVSTRRLPKSRLYKFRRPKWFQVQNTLMEEENINPYIPKVRKAYLLKKRLEKKPKVSLMKKKGYKKPLEEGRWISKYRGVKVEEKKEKHLTSKERKEKLYKERLNEKWNNTVEEEDIEPDFDIHEVPTDLMIRLEDRFIDKLNMRKYLLSLFDNSIDFKIKKSLKMRKEIMLHFLIKPYYRLDLLLWSLDCFRTSFESRQKITSKKILVNGEIGKSNYYLKKGDIISFCSMKGKGKVRNNFLKNKERYVKNECFFTFVEMDYYSNNIVILKDLYELSEDDFELLSEESVEVTEVYR